MNEDIFISYSRKDNARVIPIVRQLREEGYSVWLDEGQIEAAALWAEQIVEGIKSCRVLLFMISENSINSHNVLKEVMLASELEKAILPVYLKECRLPDRYRYQLTGIQHIELFKEDARSQVERISEALNKAGAPKAGEEQELTESTPTPPSGHKFILNKWKFVLSSLIGAFIVLWGASLAIKIGGGNWMQMIHGAELLGILTITFGALFFSYRSAVFKPWLVAFGIGVPQEEEIIRKYVKICSAATHILLFAGLLVFLFGIIQSIVKWENYTLRTLLLAAAISGPIISVVTICAIVLPTKFKLESLLSDRKVFEAQVREKQHHLDKLKQAWTQYFKKD